MSYTPNTWRPMDVITSKKLNDLEQGLTQTSDNVVYGMGGATQSSDGIHSLTYINKGDALPNNPQVGDTIFMKDGDDFSILEWDGEQWNTRVDPKLSDRIQTTLDEAKDNTQTLINNNNASINEMMDQVTKDKIAAALKDADFNAKAQAMADKALSDAKANTATVAQETIDSANQNLATAKSDLTNSIASEASARNQAVAAADSQAQHYVNQAKSDINDTINALSVGGRNYFITYTAVSGYVDTDGTVHGSSQTNADMMSDFIAVSTNDTWQLTGWGASGTAGNIVYAYYDSNKTFITGSRVVTTFPATTPSITVPVTIPSGVSYIRVSSQHMGNNQGAKVKVEKGTKPTDWTPAPEDVVLDYTTKDNQIKETITQYQETNNGKVSKAQTDATTALGLIETKVSKSDYDKKTGDLSTKINDVKQTADSSSQTIADIQEADGKQDSRMSEIENSARGLKSTVSDLSTAQDKQSGYISKLQQRADGFDATVTKVNNLSVGGRNYVLNTNVFTTTNITGFYSSVPSSYFNHKILTVSVQLDYDNVTVSSDGNRLGVEFAVLNKDGSTILIGSWKYPAVGDSFHGRISTTFDFSNNEFKDYANNQMRNGIFVQGVIGTNVSVSKPKLEIGTQATDWTPAPEDLSSATAKAQLTADNATLSINNYKTDADGRISKAQADIKANADAITQNVSKTDYDKKTGDLTAAVSKAQQTADGAVTTVGNYKTSNDARVSAAESKIEQNSKDITTKVSQTDYNQKTGELSGSISTLKQRADGFDATVTKVNNLSVGGRNYYQIVNSVVGYIGTDGVIVASSSLGVKTSDYISVTTGDTWQLTYWPSDATNRRMLYAMYDSSNNLVGSRVAVDVPNNKVSATASLVIPSGVAKIRVGAQYMADDSSKIKAEIGTIGTDWVPAPEDTDNKISTVSQKVDSITSIVSDPNTGLSTRVQTAEGALSKVQGTDIPALQKATFWQPYSSLNFNDYTKQGSFFFNTTAAKTNGPTTANSWIYLIVEQGTSDNTRIKQTAWYDGVTGVKITYVRTLNSGTWSPWYANDNDSVTTISQTNSNVTREIENRKTGDNNTLQSSKDFTTSSITNYDQGVQSTISQTASGILAQVESTNMVVNSEFDPLNGTWYTLSGSGATGSTVGGAWNAPSATSFADWPVVNGSRVISYAVGTWYTSALVNASAGNVYSASIVAGRNPAPTASTALDYRIGFWDSSRKLLTTASAGNIIDGTTTKNIQKYVVENQKAPANTKFVSVIIAHSSANAIDFIARPSLNAGVKASPYMPTYGTTSSSTVLSLFKDNWSIGINDNIGGIVSGIVGNSSQMSLISKKVVIDSPSTQITGKTWINSAMIANAAIQTVNIADAAITSAKIAQLDVAKLTGNVSSFIQSNWNGQFGSTTIDSTGMQVVSGKAKTKFGDGSMSIISALGENIGWIGRQVDSVYSNLDFLTIGLNGWQTTAQGDAHYDKDPNNPDEFYGGDGIIFGISTVGGGYLPLLMYNTPLAASYRSGIAGWMFTQPIVGGLDVFGDNMRASNTVAWRFTNIDTRGFTYPFLTSKQASDANVKTGMLLGSGTMYFYGGNNAVFSVKENGYGYYEAKKFGSGGSALYMAGDGALIAHSSATKYKTNIDRNVGKELSEKLLTVDLASWNDKDEDRQLQEYYETGKPTDYAIDMDGAKYYGLIAEDLVKADLEEFVVRNTITGSVESIQYDKIGVAWIPLVRDLRNQVNELKFEIEKIKESIK